jgi:hypothetical protein
MQKMRSVFCFVGDHRFGSFTFSRRWSHHHLEQSDLISVLFTPPPGRPPRCWLMAHLESIFHFQVERHNTRKFQWHFDGIRVKLIEIKLRSVNITARCLMFHPAIFRFGFVSKMKMCCDWRQRRSSTAERVTLHNHVRCRPTGGYGNSSVDRMLFFPWNRPER